MSLVTSRDKRAGKTPAGDSEDRRGPLAVLIWRVSSFSFPLISEKKTMSFTSQRYGLSARVSNSRCLTWCLLLECKVLPQFPSLSELFHLIGFDVNYVTMILIIVFSFRHWCSLWVVPRCFPFVEKITCFLAHVRNVSVRLVSQKSRQVKMRRNQWTAKITADIIIVSCTWHTLQ